MKLSKALDKNKGRIISLLVVLVFLPREFASADERPTTINGGTLLGNTPIGVHPDHSKQNKELEKRLEAIKKAKAAAAKKAAASKKAVDAKKAANAKKAAASKKAVDAKKAAAGNKQL
jgi:colicin import membrane protein